MSHDTHLVKRKTKKGSVYLIIGVVFLIPLLIIGLVGYLASNNIVDHLDFSGSVIALLMTVFVFPFIGISLALKGIITLAKRHCLTDREFTEKRLQQLEDEKFENRKHKTP